MRGFLIRLRYLGMCDIIVEHDKVQCLLYHAVSSISLADTSSIWLDISVLLLPTFHVIGVRSARDIFGTESVISLEASGIQRL